MEHYKDCCWVHYQHGFICEGEVLAQCHTLPPTLLSTDTTAFQDWQLPILLVLNLSAAFDTTDYAITIYLFKPRAGTWGSACDFSLTCHRGTIFLCMLQYVVCFRAQFLGLLIFLYRCFSWASVLTAFNLFVIIFMWMIHNFVFQ